MKEFRVEHLKADFHSVEFSDWTGNSLLMCENFAVNVNKMLRVTKILLSKIQSAWEILLSGSQAKVLPYFTVETKWYSHSLL